LQGIVWAIKDDKSGEKKRSKGKRQRRGKRETFRVRSKLEDGGGIRTWARTKNKGEPAICVEGERGVMKIGLKCNARSMGAEKEGDRWGGGTGFVTLVRKGR